MFDLRQKDRIDPRSACMRLWDSITRFCTTREGKRCYDKVQESKPNSYHLFQTSVSRKKDEGRLYFRCQAHNLPPTLHSEVRTDHTINTRAQHFPFVVQQNRSIVVESDKPSVRSPDWFPSADDHSASDVPASDFDSGSRSLHGCRNWTRGFNDAYNLVADGTPSVVDFVFENVDTFDEQRARVVYDLGHRQCVMVLRKD
jgi:hypothetical protein